ncbi:hypothetical protein M405DRAFT_824454 [Rhizopogon salebrosus TDB-379]|nr:hypothetical protein M405DRAFT_824454 [Rhizopogon salebrosus TDB-379]
MSRPTGKPCTGAGTGPKPRYPKSNPVLPERVRVRVWPLAPGGLLVQIPRPPDLYLARLGWTRGSLFSLALVILLVLLYLSRTHVESIQRILLLASPHSLRSHEIKSDQTETVLLMHSIVLVI